MDDPRETAQAGTGEPAPCEAIESFLSLAEELQANLEAMSAVLVDFTLPATEAGGEEVREARPEQPREAGAVEVKVDLNLALSAVGQIIGRLERGEAPGAIPAESRVSEAIDSILNCVTDTVVEIDREAVAAPVPAASGRLEDIVRRRENRTSSTVTAEADETTTDLLHELQTASEAIRAVERVSEVVSSLASGDAVAPVRVHAPAQFSVEAEPRPAAAVPVPAGSYVNLPSFSPRKKAVEEARSRVEETSASVRESARTYQETQSKQSEAIQSALTAASSRETVSDHLQTLTEAADRVVSSQQMLELLEHSLEPSAATAASGGLEEGDQSLEVSRSLAAGSLSRALALETSETETRITEIKRLSTAMNHFLAASGVQADKVVNLAGTLREHIESSGRERLEVLSLGEIMGDHVSQMVGGSGEPGARWVGAESLASATAPAGNASPLQALNRSAGRAAVWNLSTLAPQLAPAGDLPSRVLTTMALSAGSGADRVREAPQTTNNFHNTFNVTVNVKGGSEEKEMKELGRKISQILSDELRRYGGM